MQHRGLLLPACYCLCLTFSLPLSHGVIPLLYSFSPSTVLLSLCPCLLVSYPFSTPSAPALSGSLCPCLLVSCPFSTPSVPALSDFLFVPVSWCHAPFLLLQFQHCLTFSLSLSLGVMPLFHSFSSSTVSWHCCHRHFEELCTSSSTGQH